MVLFRNNSANATEWLSSRTVFIRAKINSKFNYYVSNQTDCHVVNLLSGIIIKSASDQTARE